MLCCCSNLNTDNQPTDDKPKRSLVTRNCPLRDANVYWSLISLASVLASVCRPTDVSLHKLRRRVMY